MRLRLGRCTSAHQHRGNVGQRSVGHFLGQFHDNPALNFFVQMFAKFAESFWRSDNNKCLKIPCQRAKPQLVCSVGGIAIFVELVKIGFVYSRVAITTALRGQTGTVGFQLMVLAVRTLVVGLRDQFDMIALALIAEEQHLAAIGDKDECVMWNSHKEETREAASGSVVELLDGLCIITRVRYQNNQYG